MAFLVALVGILFVGWASLHATYLTHWGQLGSLLPGWLGGAIALIFLAWCLGD